MTLAEAGRKAARDRHEKAGSPASYTPFGGLPIATKVIVEKGVRPYPSPEEMLVTEPITAVYVLREDVPENRRGDVIDVDGESFTVDGQLDDDGFVARLKVR